MLNETLQKLFVRELGKLKKEIGSYQNEEKLWVTEKGISNSGGNLCLHLIGNLNTYIADGLGHSGYVRQRDLEFSTKGMPKAVLMEKIDATTEAVSATILKLTLKDLQADCPVLKFEEKTSTEFLLIHLLAHLTYHLGQINYHRRLVGGSAESE